MPKHQLSQYYSDSLTKHIIIKKFINIPKRPQELMKF